MLIQQFFRRPKTMDQILSAFAEAHDDLQDHADYHRDQVIDKNDKIHRLGGELDGHRKSMAHAERVREALTPFLPEHFSP